MGEDEDEDEDEESSGNVGDGGFSRDGYTCPVTDAHNSLTAFLLVF